jgi:putative ATP-binding cassette transporter
MELLSRQPELEAFHNREVVLERRAGGADLVSDIKLVKRPGRKKLISRF